MRLKVNIVILNFNGRDLLEKYLPSIVTAAGVSRHECAVTVLDNASTDSSVEYVQNHFPQAHVIVSPLNRVLCSYNEAVIGLRDDIVILLNNDIRPDPDFVDPLVDELAGKEDAFFAATHQDRALPRWHWGVLSADDPAHGNGFFKSPGYAFTAGIAAFDRKKFVELGGYDELYLPGRYEDVDLCYRAWKRGWKGYYVPASRKYHEGGVSFDKRFGWSKTQAMVYRNSLLFMIKNIQDPWYLAGFLMFLPLRLSLALLQGKWFIWRGFFDSFERLGLAFRRRREVAGKAILSDRDVLRVFKSV